MNSFLNWFMPAGVKRTVGSLGTSTSLGRRTHPLVTKKSRNASRSSSVFMVNQQKRAQAPYSSGVATLIPSDILGHKRGGGKPRTASWDRDGAQVRVQSDRTIERGDRLGEVAWAPDAVVADLSDQLALL